METRAANPGEKSKNGLEKSCFFCHWNHMFMRSMCIHIYFIDMYIYIYIWLYIYICVCVFVYACLYYIQVSLGYNMLVDVHTCTISMYYKYMLVWIITSLTYRWTMVSSNDHVGMKFPLLLSAVMGSPNNCVNKQLVQQRSICVAISLTLCGKRETILRAFTLSPDLRHVLFLIDVFLIFSDPPSLENACFNAYPLVN